MPELPLSTHDVEAPDVEVPLDSVDDESMQAVMCTTFSIVLKASRPLSSLYFFLHLGNGMLHSGAMRGLTDLLRLVFLTFTFSIPITIIIFGVNDVYDYETDKRNPRKLANGPEGGVLHPVHHKDVLVASYISTILILFSALATQNHDTILATIPLVILAWQYSSPPLRFKEIPVLDSLSNGCITLLIWFFGFSLSGSSFSDVPLKPVVNHLCMVAGHVIGAVADYEVDNAVGMTTIATVMGKRPAALICAVCFAVGSLAVDPVGSFPWLSTAIMLLPCFNLRWAHFSMRAIVVFVFASHIFRVVTRLWSLRDTGDVACVLEVIFDTQLVPFPSSCMR